VSITPVSQRYARDKIITTSGQPVFDPHTVTARSLASSPYTVLLDYLHWPIQFESKGTSKTNDVIAAVDHWSIWEPV
jgi:hypothetical protein